jgi:hypothetical protein
MIAVFIFNVKMYLKETDWENVEWIPLAQDMEQWRTLVRKVMKLRVQRKAGSSLSI